MLPPSARPRNAAAGYLCYNFFCLPGEGWSCCLGFKTFPVKWSLTDTTYRGCYYYMLSYWINTNICENRLNGKLAKEQQCDRKKKKNRPQPRCLCRPFREKLSKDNFLLQSLSKPLQMRSPFVSSLTAALHHCTDLILQEEEEWGKSAL